VAQKINVTDTMFEEEDPYHARLEKYPVFFACLGVIHTLLTAGIVFGWASLLPVLRSEGIDLSPSDFARIFTHGAIGNYLSTLPFGLMLDNLGPKYCGITASILFAVGLFLCSLADSSTLALDAGFALLGFSGPAIQLPTLHLARLFPGEPREGGSGGAALLMSAQAGAFDGGTMVFALFSAGATVFGITSSTFFLAYMVVPLFTLLTAIFVWPNEILPDPTPLTKRHSFASPYSYLSPASHADASSLSASSLKDRPLSVILTRPPFYCLSFWVAIHILKLNFIVASLNDQLADSMDQQTADILIGIFGAMLPFGFVVLPLVAFGLANSTMACFQAANIIGVLYGLVLTFFPHQAWYQVLLVFSSVATSRQLVYSTVFHQTGELFGFKNYGILLGLTNIIVSSVSLVQGPLVEWAEASEDYFGANMILLLATLPLFGLVFFVVPKPPTKVGKRKPTEIATEGTALLGGNETRRQRSNSDAGVVA
jgi:MFS family permease